MPRENGRMTSIQNKHVNGETVITHRIFFADSKKKKRLLKYNHIGFN